MDEAAGPAPVDTVGGAAQDDSTYESMLAFAQSDARAASTARDIVEERNRFVLTADDPQWGRRTEQVDLVGVLHEDFPAGLPLRRQWIIGQAVGDRLGIIVTCTRDRPDARSP